MIAPVQVATSQVAKGPFSDQPFTLLEGYGIDSFLSGDPYATSATLRPEGEKPSNGAKNGRSHACDYAATGLRPDARSQGRRTVVANGKEAENPALARLSADEVARSRRSLRNAGENDLVARARDRGWRAEMRSSGLIVDCRSGRPDPGLLDELHAWQLAEDATNDPAEVCLRGELAEIEEAAQ